MIKRKNKLKKNMQEQRGFTLVELLIVIALLGLSLGVTSDILTSLVRSYSKTQTKNELEQHANFVGLKLEKEIRTAESVTVAPGATSSTDGYTNAIMVRKPDSTVVYYRVDSSRVQMSDNNSNWYDVTYYATNDIKAVEVDCLFTGSDAVVYCFKLAATTPEVVSMGLNLSPVVEGNTVFQGSIPIRNSITVRSQY